MSSFLDFYEQELVNEKRGRVSKDPNHDKNIEFIKSYYPDRTISKTNYTNYINGTRERFRKAIEAHDAQLLKDLQDDSLETLHQIIVTNNISLQKKKKVQPLGQAKSGTGRNLNWRKAEKDIVAGFSKLLQDNFFSYKDKNGNVHKVDDTGYEVKQAGGGRQSDIKISRADNEKVAVFIESKLNFLAAEYFKFGLKVVDGKIKYDHHYFIEGSEKEEKDRVDKLFKDTINLEGFLNEVMQSDDVRDYWEMFLRNLIDIEEMVATDTEFAPFAKDVQLSRVFPNNAKALVKVFDKYCEHYIEKYNSLMDQIYNTYGGNKFMDGVNQFYIDDHTENGDFKGTFFNVDYMMELFYARNDHHESLGNKTYKIDEQKMMALSDELKTIEVKFTRILQSAGLDEKNACQLYNLDDIDKLRYFFSAFVSSVGKKARGAQASPLLGNDLEKDSLGNMQVCPEVLVENSRLGQMITDFYQKKDKCIYVQIMDTVYAFSEEHNIFQIPGLPVFKDVLTKFLVKITVSDNLENMRLHIRAVEPEGDVSRKLSFKADDENFVGKKLHNVVIEPKK